jgi:hypothetical protein
MPSEPAKGKEAIKPPEQIHGLKPEIASDEKTAGVKPGFPATPKSESNKTVQPHLVPPVVVEPTNTANTVVMAPASTPTPEPKSQAAANPLPTTTESPLHKYNQPSSVLDD